MTIDQATDIIYDVSHKQGEPVTRDVAEIIAKKLMTDTPVHHEPGFVAQHQRDRYDTTDLQCAHTNGCPFPLICAGEHHCDALFNGYR
jgi:hypothetical protein